MKFSKKICKQCREGKWCWAESDEVRWKDGKLICRALWVNRVGRSYWKHADLKEEVPSECPYKLEHTVMGNTDEAQ